LFGIILESLANLSDRAVDAIVGIEKNALAPDLLYDLIPGDEFTFMLDEK
jgi:hypothetical protein